MAEEERTAAEWIAKGKSEWHSWRRRNKWHSWLRRDPAAEYEGRPADEAGVALHYFEKAVECADMDNDKETETIAFFYRAKVRGWTSQRHEKIEQSIMDLFQLTKQLPKCAPAWEAVGYMWYKGAMLGIAEEGEEPDKLEALKLAQRSFDIVLKIDPQRKSAYDLKKRVLEEIAKCKSHSNPPMKR